MLIGYARVSATDQKPTLQKDALRQAGCQRIVTDVASGAQTTREGLTEVLEFLRERDTLVVWKLDRLGRSLRELLTLFDELKGRDIKLKSLTEALDTQTPTGRAMWQMVGVLAELERSLIRERTQAGRTAAIARGVKMGRKPKLSSHQVVHARKLIEEGESPRPVAQLLGVARSTLYATLSREQTRVPPSEQLRKQGEQRKARMPRDSTPV